MASAIGSAKPCGVTPCGETRDFVLQDGNKLYFFVHGLRITGDGNVVVDRGGSEGSSAFTGIPAKIKNIRWTDDRQGRLLHFEQEGDRLQIDFTHFPYGTDLVVRVAEAELDETL